jgi:hypothetical protein
LISDIPISGGAWRDESNDNLLGMFTDVVNHAVIAHTIPIPLLFAPEPFYVRAIERICLQGSLKLPYNFIKYFL